MIARFLVILMIFVMGQWVPGFSLIENLRSMTRVGVMPGEEKSLAVTPGEVMYFAQEAGRVVELKDGSSRNSAPAPPCSVIGISGNKLILKDFYGRQEAILVEDGKDLRGVKVGDKVVVKDGVLMIGFSPQ